MNSVNGPKLSASPLQSHRLSCHRNSCASSAYPAGKGQGNPHLRLFLLSLLLLLLLLSLLSAPFSEPPDTA